MPLFLVDESNMVTSIEYQSELPPEGYTGPFHVGEPIQPDVDMLKTKDAILMYKPGEGLYYEYVDRPMTQEERDEAMQMESADLMLQNAMQDMAISQLQADNAELMLMVANTQLGGN